MCFSELDSHAVILIKISLSQTPIIYVCQHTGSNLFKPGFPVQTTFIEHLGSRIIAVSELSSIEETRVLGRTIMAVCSLPHRRSYRFVTQSFLSHVGQERVTNP